MNESSTFPVVRDLARPAPRPAQTGYEVVCICGGLGFPYGGGGPARITMVGKSVIAGGVGFSLIHCGPSPVPLNTQKSGVHEGIAFEYTTRLRRPTNDFARSLVYLRAVAGLTLRLIRLRNNRDRTSVWLYFVGGSLNLYAILLCRLMGLPVVQEVCEWWPSVPTCSSFTKWLYRKHLFTGATGVLVISKLIEQRVREIAASVNPDLLIYRLPSIVDAERFAASRAAPVDAVPAERRFVWCGDRDWQKDVKFIIRAIGEAQRKGCPCSLTIIGAFTEEFRTSIAQCARENDVPLSDIVYVGYVDNRTLEAHYRSAAALLLPLPDDDRSRTRMPNKLGEYLASGRPVITCGVGDLTEFLVHGENAYLAEPGNASDFAEQMISVLRDPTKADSVGAAGREACWNHLDYRVYIHGLAEAFVKCTARGGAPCTESIPG